MKVTIRRSPFCNHPSAAAQPPIPLQPREIVVAWPRNKIVGAKTEMAELVSQITFSCVEDATRFIVRVMPTSESWSSVAVGLISLNNRFKSATKPTASLTRNSRISH